MRNNRCQQQLLRTLTLHGTWANRDVLAQGTDYGDERLEDELASLVLAGSVIYNERAREYRLAGEPTARRAAQLLLQERGATPGPGALRRKVVARPVAQGQQGEQYRVGLAVLGADDALVMAEVQIPGPLKLEQVLQLTQCVQNNLGAP